MPAGAERLGPGPRRPRPMVLPTCPMAEFALPRHSAVMERLRRRIELCRRHHSTCEARYEAVSPERLELERQHTFALHQRCIQAKAKRAGKHRQPPAAAPAPAPASAPAPAPAPAAARLDAADGPEHGRPVAVSTANSCRISPFSRKRLPRCGSGLGEISPGVPTSGSGSWEEANMAGSWALVIFGKWHCGVLWENVTTVGSLSEVGAGKAEL